MAAQPTPPPDSARLAFARVFLREALGCGCAEEVLRHVSIEDMPGGPTVLRVGGRLLVHVHVCAQPEELERKFSGWLRYGLARRDAEGFRRLRLVLASDRAEILRSRAEALFAHAGVDAQAHLHLLDLAQVQQMLPAIPAGRGAQPGLPSTRGRQYMGA